MTNLLTRTYNSTLGVPQQFLYRFIRALKDEDIDLFSREGILAPELLPLVGVAASHETDATVDEVIGDHGTAGNLIADILLDPATYLTAGATGLAKAGKAVRAGTMRKGGKEMAEAGIDLMAHKTAGELRQTMMVAAQEGKLTTRASKRAIKELGKIDADTAVLDMMKSTGKEDLLISIPGLARWGAEVRAPQAIQKHKSWFALQNSLIYGKAVDTTKPILAWMGGKIRGMGDNGEMLMDGLADMAGIPQALKKGFGGLDSKFRLDSREFGNDEWWSAKYRAQYGKAAQKIERTDIQQTAKRLREKLAAGAGLEELLKTRGIPKELRDEIRGWPKSKTRPVAVENMAEEIPKYLREVQDNGRKAKRLLDKSEATFVRKTKQDFGHWTGDAAFEMGQWLRKKKQLIFGRGETVTKSWLKDLQDHHLEREAKGRLILEQQQKQLIADVEHLAKATGKTTDDVKALLKIHTEGSLHPLDLAANMGAIKKGGKHTLAAAQNYTDILGRMRGTIEALRLHTDLDKDSLKWLDALDSHTLEILSHKGMHWDRREMVELTAEQLAPEFQQHAGKRLHELSDDELRQLRKSEATLDPDSRTKIRQLLARRTSGEAIDSTKGAPVLSRFNADEVIQSKRIQELDEDTLKARIKETDDPKLRRKLRDTLRRKRKGLPPKAAWLDTPVPHPLGDNLTPEMQVLVDYELALADLTQGRFTSLTLERLEAGTQSLARLVPEQAKKVFAGVDPKVLDRVFGLSDDATRLAHQANGFSMGAPLGYLPRMRNRRSERKLGQLIGRLDENRTALKGVESNMKKRLDNGRSLTLDEIGSVLDEVAEGTKAGRELATEVREFLKKEGLKPGTYHQDHLDLMFARMDRDFNQANSARLIDEAFNHEEAWDLGIAGGRIVEVLDGSMETIKHTAKKTAVKAGKKGVKQTTKAAETSVPARTIIIERADGKRMPVDLHEMVAEGKSVELLGTEAESLGNAFVAHQLGGANLNALHEVQVGQWVVAGGDDVLSMFRSNVAPAPSKWADALAGYDFVNFALKRFQTVLRPAHHVGNLISGIFQSQAAGASIGSIAAAHHDVGRMILGLGEDGAKLKGGMLRATGFKGKFSAGRRTADAILGLVTERKLGDVLDDVGGIVIDGREMSHADIWGAAVEDGLLTGTFAREEVKIGGRTSTEAVEARGRLEALRYKDDKTWREGVSDIWKDLEGTTQIPEITARMSTVYALLYDGHSIPDALQLAKRAHVDYSKLGIGERQILKRLIPYYTFGRNYIPFALEKMARSPRLIKGWQSAVEQSGLMGVDSNGKVVFEKDKFQADLGRMNANIDALMSVMGVAEHLLPGSIATVKGVQSVESPPFMAVGGGGAAGLVKESIGEDGFEADSFGKALMDATFVGRMFESLYETTTEADLNPVNDFLTSMVLPARVNNDPNRSRQFQANMARRALRRIELSLKEAKSPQEAQGLLQEANDIRQALLTVQKDFSN